MQSIITHSSPPFGSLALFIILFSLYYNVHAHLFFVVVVCTHATSRKFLVQAEITNLQKLRNFKYDFIYWALQHIHSRYTGPAASVMHQKSRDSHPEALRTLPSLLEFLSSFPSSGNLIFILNPRHPPPPPAPRQKNEKMDQECSSPLPCMFYTISPIIMQIRSN